MIADAKVVPEALPYLTAGQGYARTFTGCCVWSAREEERGTRYTCSQCKSSYLWPRGRK